MNAPLPEHIRKALETVTLIEKLKDSGISVPRALKTGNKHVHFRFELKNSEERRELLKIAQTLVPEARWLNSNRKA